jgi:transposase
VGDEQKSSCMRISRSQILVIVNAALHAPHAAGQPALAEMPAEERDRLVRWVRAATTPQRVVTRAVIVLLSAAGWSNVRVALALGVSRRTVALWKSRFAERGADTLLVDAPGRGRKPGRNHQIVSRIVAMTSVHPPDGRRWTVRTLAQAVGVSHATVQRVWREQDIRPGQSAARAI